jgi:hypothetical protein
VKQHGSQFDATPITNRIRKALTDLDDSRFDDGLRQRATSRLGEAGDALVERNEVLHSYLVTFEPWPGMEPGDLTPMLAHVPRGKPWTAVQTTMTVIGLRPIANRLWTALNGWSDLAAALWMAGR